MNSGNEIGPFKAIEESTLAHLASDNVRADVFAWYVALGTVGMASGTIACGWVVQSRQALPGWTEIHSYRTIFWMYSALGSAKIALGVFLSERCERQRSTGQSEGETSVALLGVGTQEPEDHEAVLEVRRDSWLMISKRSRLNLIKISILFAVNSLGSGMVPL